MASLSNINGLFDVHSTGAILFSTSHGTSGQILRSNGNAAPTWVAASTVIGGPYLPLTGGTLSGPLSGTSATFSGNVTSTNLLTVIGDGHLFLGATGETPKIDMMYVDSASGLGWDTRIFTGKTDDLPNGQGFPTSTSAGGYGTQYQANSDGAFFGILPYTAGHYRPVINWGDDVTDSPFSFQFNGVDKATVSSAGVITAPTFVGALTGNATTASSAAQVTINYNNNSNADYQMLWGSGNNVYGTAGVVVNALSNTVTATTFNGALTGNAYSASSLEQHGNNSNPNNLNTLPWGKTSNYASGGYWSNGPSGMSYGSVYNLGGYTGNSALALEIAGDITHNSTSSTKDLWFRMGNNLGFQNDWKKIWNSQNLPNPTQGGPYLPLTGGTLTGALQIGNYTDATETITIATSSNGTGRINFYDNNNTEGGSIRVVGQNLGSKMYFSNRWNTDSDKIVFDLINGKVGIGTTGPAAKLHVKGGDISVEETGGNGNKIFFTTDHNSHLIMSNGYWIDIIGNANEVFRVFGGVSTTTEFLRVTGSGYTKLTNNGDTTWQGYNFHAITQSAASQPTLMIYNSASTGNQYGVNVVHTSTSANTTGRFFLGATNNGATEKIKIYTNGNIQNINNSYTQLSDLSLKENVVDATDKLEEVKKLRVINWNFIGDDLKQIGVAAQEVEKIFPGLVDEVEHNQDGETSMVKSVKYSVFVPILIKAIQELETRVKELENK